LKIYNIFLKKDSKIDLVLGPLGTSIKLYTPRVEATPFEI